MLFVANFRSETITTVPRVCWALGWAVAVMSRKALGPRSPEPRNQTIYGAGYESKAF